VHLTVCTDVSCVYSNRIECCGKPEVVCVFLFHLHRFAVWATSRPPAPHKAVLLPLRGFWFYDNPTSLHIHRFLYSSTTLQTSSLHPSYTRRLLQDTSSHVFPQNDHLSSIVYHTINTNSQESSLDPPRSSHGSTQCPEAQDHQRGRYVTPSSNSRAIANHFPDDQQDQQVEAVQQDPQNQTTVAAVKYPNAEETFRTLFDGLACKSSSQLIPSQHTNRSQSTRTPSMKKASASMSACTSSAAISPS
jgi:hypothetical protein